MAGTQIREATPTLAAVALDLSHQGGLGSLRPEEVAYAARRRNVDVRDGRVSRGSLSDIYFELRRLKGLTDGA